MATKMTPKSTQTNGGGAFDPRAIRGQAAGGPRAVRGRAAFWAVLPACAPAVNSRKSLTGASFFGARPENEHRAQAPRAVGNQGFEGSKCY